MLLSRPGPTSVGLSLFRALLFLSPTALDVAYDEAKFRLEQKKLTPEEFQEVIDRLRELGWEGKEPLPVQQADLPSPPPRLLLWQTHYRCKLCQKTFFRPLPASFRTAGDAHRALIRQSRSKQLPLHAEEVEGVQCLGVAEVIGLGDPR